MLDAIDSSIAEDVDDIRGGGLVDEHDDRRTKLSGPLLVAAITSVCSSGFLLFGYDQGGSLDQPSFDPLSVYLTNLSSQASCQGSWYRTIGLPKWDIRVPSWSAP